MGLNRLNSPPMIESTVIDNVIAATSLTDLIGEEVELRESAGGVVEGLCPFHNEATPSFKVYPDHYHCYGCKAHGNAIRYVMERQGLSFPDAVKQLAARVGIVVTETTNFQRNEKNKDKLDTLRRACGRFEHLLHSTEDNPALQELARRAIEPDTVMRFGLGYAPDAWNTLTGDRQFDWETLHAVGLATKRTQGKGYYDFFRDRLIFPIRNGQGEVIAFGGRILGATGPKYLNSPESDFYKKGSGFFGLTQAEAAIRTSGELIVCEGFFDVLTPAQHGVENVVSTCGTAITAVQIELALSLAKRIVFCFDGDKAGRAATWRVAEMIISMVDDSQEVCICRLPEGHDPDSYVREAGIEAFSSLVANAPTITSYICEVLTGQALTPESKSIALGKAFALLNSMSAPMLRLFFSHAIYTALEIRESDFVALYESQPKPQLDDPVLRGCPCCGTVCERTEDEDYVLIRCGRCGVSLTAPNMDDAMRRWNRRTKVTKPETRVAA